MLEDSSSAQYLITDLMVDIVESDCVKGGDVHVDCENCDFSPKEGCRKGSCNFGTIDAIKILRSKPFLMRSPEEIKIRLVEVTGEIRRMDGKCTLVGFDLPEEWEVYEALCTERDILKWVIYP